MCDDGSSLFVMSPSPNWPYPAHSTVDEDFSQLSSWCRVSHQCLSHLRSYMNTQTILSERSFGHKRLCHNHERWVGIRVKKRAWKLKSQKFIRSSKGRIKTTWNEKGKTSRQQIRRCMKTSPRAPECEQEEFQKRGVHHPQNNWP